jgi:hypothetical protein
VVVAMAFSFGWLARRTGSVWPAAVAHGANNCIGAGFLLTPRGWGWDTGTMVVAAALVGCFFAIRAYAERLPYDAMTAGAVPRSRLGAPAAPRS